MGVCGRVLVGVAGTQATWRLPWTLRLKPATVLRTTATNLYVHACLWALTSCLLVSQYMLAHLCPTVGHRSSIANLCLPMFVPLLRVHSAGGTHHHGFHAVVWTDAAQRRASRVDQTHHVYGRVHPPTYTRGSIAVWFWAAYYSYVSSLLPKFHADTPMCACMSCIGDGRDAGVYLFGTCVPVFLSMCFCVMCVMLNV